MELQTLYREQVRPKLKEELGFKSIMAVPRLQKVVIDVGIGKLGDSTQEREQLEQDLAKITGQKSQIRQARVAIAGFNTRKGSPVGIRVTLRGKRMYAFIERLFKIVLPRLRDFRGVKAGSFDGRGSYTLGLVEHTIFPEVDIAGKMARPHGMGVTIVTSSKSDSDAKRLLEELGMPFEKGASA